MITQPYHKYVFNVKHQSFVGKFEEMYQREEIEGYDSWFQDDLTSLQKQVARDVLLGHHFSNILDLGCGKGAFTNVLKREDNYVMGIDISPTAISRARIRHPSIDFRVMEASILSSLDRTFDLVVAMEILSYLMNWRSVLETISQISEYLYLTLSIPINPIGFVKSFEDLEIEVLKNFTVEIDTLLPHPVLCLLLKSK